MTRPSVLRVRPTSAGIADFPQREQGFHAGGSYSARTTASPLRRTRPLTRSLDPARPRVPAPSLPDLRSLPRRSLLFSIRTTRNYQLWAARRKA